VVAVTSRSWRTYAAPAAFLAAVTVAVVGVRMLWPHQAVKTTSPRQTQTHPARHASVKRVAAKRFYRVRAGDTLAAIAVRTHTPIADLERLNPTVQPTALFIGQRLRLP